MPPRVLAALEHARAQGFLGAGPLEGHVEHALGFVAAARAAGLLAPPGRVIDLGSGGGIPGLVLAATWTRTDFVLLDSNRRRCEALRQAVEANGWGGRVQVVLDRAERAGRDPAFRGVFDLVTARSFGAPPVVAECGAPFLRVGGLLVVSEPPVASGPGEDGVSGAPVAHPDRWPTGRLAEIGLRPACFLRDGFGFQVLELFSPCPDRLPRREGVPVKRPLY